METFSLIDGTEDLKHVANQANHTILYDLSTLNGSTPPKPNEKQNLNNELSFVTLPCVRNKMQRRSNEPLWPLIIKSLWKEFNFSHELEKAISEYNPNIGKFKALHAYCEQLDNKEEFFRKTLPAIIELALKLPTLVKTNIPLLKQGLNHSISLSQEQIACLLANAFLCTFPDKRSPENSGQSFPDINFNRLLQSNLDRVVEKIKCIVNYFERVTKNMPIGVLTFVRRSIGNDHLPDWSKTNMPLSKTFLHILPNGKIEDAFGLLQVNFSNKYIGGKILGDNCYQEEIRSAIFPELIISRLFTEFLKDNEALVIVGAEQFSKYVGYANSFKFDGNHHDITPLEAGNNRRQCYIVAIDALNFTTEPSTQYEKNCIKRELNKAYVGFYHSIKDAVPPGVASGNWGCGSFKGDPQLKSLIQLIACTISQRPLHYFTFGSTSLSESLLDIYNYLKDNNMNTIQLWEYMNEYKYHRKSNENLFSFIKRRHNIFKA